MTHIITRLCLRDTACTEDILPNYDFFTIGPGYSALDYEEGA